ncbi:MAG: hypothetical protein IJ410_06715 [Oscillospiraceae bacterium]|nr:hypothetical protein [Oscillospiraceae bacterium]
MTGRKAFFITFVTTLSLMMTAYGLLYLVVDHRVTETDTPQQGIAVAQPGVHDTRNLMVCVGDEDCRFFFVFRFNAPQSKISVVSISPSYKYSSTGHSLDTSMEKAGILQCVMDTKQEFGIEIDNYLCCSWEEMRTIIQDFTDFGIDQLGENLPLPIKKLLLKSAEKLDSDSLINALEKRNAFLDNELGLAFLNECAYLLLYANGENLDEYAGKRLKDCYSLLDTNINTRSLKDYRRIVRFLDPAVTEYVREVIIAGDTDAAAKASRAFLE